MSKLLTELLGAFFLMLVIGLTGQPLYIGLVLMIVVYMGGPVSGGHYNPAVTLGARLAGKIGTGDTIKYWIAQFAGAMLAAGLCAWLTGKGPVPSIPLTDNPAAVGGAVALAKPLAVEFLFTFLLVLVVLNVACSNRSKGNSYFGAAIGLTIAVAATAGGPVSGGAFNPAIGLGGNIVGLIHGVKVDPNVWLLYSLGPLAGGAVAATVFGVQEKASNA